MHCSTTSLPKRLELWFRTVFALPKASSTGDVCSSRASSRGVPKAAGSPEPAAAAADSAIAETSLSAAFVVSVLPEPDSPDTRRTCERRSFWSSANARAATPKMCGGSAARAPSLCA